MFLPLLFVVALQSSIAPELPAGVGSEFQAACLEVEGRLEAKDFAKAQRLASHLPSLDVPYQWSDANVRPADRTHYIEIRDRLFKIWGHMVPGLTFKESTKPAMKFGFEKVLAKVPDSDLPAGAALFFSPPGEGPMVESVIGLTRGNPAVEVTDAEVYNETSYAIGRYLGLAPSPIPGSALGRTDLPGMGFASVSPIEASRAQELMAITQKLRDAAEHKKTMTPTKPSVFLDPVKLDGATVLQGKKIDFSLQLTNRGNSTLNYWLQPDCGCFSLKRSGKVEAGGSALVQIRMDTTQYHGPVEKKIALFTNDPANPSILLPVTVNIRPRYQFIRPGGSVVVVPDGGANVDVYLAISEGAGLDATSADFHGIAGTVKYVPWKGVLADPENGEGAKPRTGYKFTIHLDDSLPPGRASGTLSVETTNPDFPSIRFNLSAQKGIVALPDQLYMGELGGRPVPATILLSRPHSVYKILGVACDLASFSAKFSALPQPGEYKVEITYDGKATIGEFHGLLTITTDDPKQPKILVPISGVVR